MHFLLLSFWESSQAIVAYAGTDIAKAHYCRTTTWSASSIRHLTSNIMKSFKCARHEEVFETQARPADRTGFSRKIDCSALHAPTKPVEKLLLLPFDQHRETSDTKSRDDRPMRLQFAHEPVSPVRMPGMP